jgi:hypothetical protein
VEEFRTSIFEKKKEKFKKRLLSNLLVAGAIVGIWFLYFIGFPGTEIGIGIKTAIGFSIAVLSIKLYDDKYNGITAYGERSATLVITEQYLEIKGVIIPYTNLTNLVIYVEEYLGMPKEFFGIHHGGNNLIEFSHNGMSVSINYIIKNKQDYDRVSRLVDRVEKDPSLKKNLRKLD